MSGLARQFGPEAIYTMVHLMRKAKSEKIRLTAADLVLQRGCGKPGLSVPEKEESQNNGDFLADEVLEALLDS